MNRMKQPTQRKLQLGRKQQRGLCALEFSIIAPLLVVLMLAVLDFGRVMYTAMTVTSAARAGAGYAAQTSSTAIDNSGIIAASLADASNLKVDAFNTNHVPSGKLTVECSPIAVSYTLSTAFATLSLLLLLL